MTVLDTIDLPCGVSRVEHALLKASHAGHWHDAEFRMDGDTLVLSAHETRQADDSLSE